MRLPRFIKIPHYSRFEYKPLYYNERKERLDAKIREAQKEKEESDGEQNNFKPDFKGKFNNKYARDITAKQKKAASIRLLIILVFLALITYLFLDRAEIFTYMLEVLLSD